jgi:hypothetical protein
MLITTFTFDTITFYINKNFNLVTKKQMANKAKYDTVFDSFSKIGLMVTLFFKNIQNVLDILNQRVD